MKYNILFLVDNRGSLRMFVRYCGRKISLSLGYSVDAGKWDKDAQRCKRNTTHGRESIPASVINREIQRYEDAVNKVFLSLDEETTAEEVKKLIHAALRPSQEKEEKVNIFDIYNRYIEEQTKENQWSKAVVYKHRQIIGELQQMSPSLEFGDINAQFLSKYRNFLLGKGFQNETIKKKISVFKWFLRWLVSKNMLQDMSFTTYKVKLKQSHRDVVFLKWEELMSVYHHEFQDGYLSRVRDVFCFCCFTSLRYSDVRKLKKTDICGDVMNVITQKTNVSLRIELNDYAKSILEKYEKNGDEYALPVISSQRMNEYLKEVCRLCEINDKVTSVTYIGDEKTEITEEKWKVISTHSGRRTFICNALMLGIAPSIVMKWTGHSDYRAMKPYIDIADEAKKEAMNLFNKK